MNTLFLCITGQPDWTLVDLCPKFSLKPLAFIISQLFCLLISFFLFFFFFSFFREGPRIEEHFHRIEKGEEVDMLTEICPKSYIFHLGRLCARACVCVCFTMKKKSARRMASTASDTSYTSSKQQQAQRKKKNYYTIAKGLSHQLNTAISTDFGTEKRKILLNPHMSQSTCFGSLIKTGVDCKEDTGSQGQCRQQRRKGKMTLTVEHFSLTAKTANTSK